MKISVQAFLLSFLAVSTSGVKAHVSGFRAGRNLVECNEPCNEQGSCASGLVNLCHEGKEDECLDASEWEEHCEDFGDTCGKCPASGGSGGGGTTCFSGSSSVFVRGQGAVKMEDAKVGDMVLTSNSGTFEPIFAFGHLDKSATGSFLKISTHGGSSLEITGEHLLFLNGKTNPVRADSIQVGDKLQIAEADGDSTVKSIKPLTKKGLYAPLTPSGKIVVDGIVASTYVALKNKDSDPEYFPMFNGSFKVAHQDYVHFYLAPFRFVCMSITDKPCQVHGDEDGIPQYVAWGMNAIDWIYQAQNNSFLHMMFLAFSVPILLAFAAAEVIFGSTFGLLAMFASAVMMASYYKGPVSFNNQKQKVV